MDSPSIAETIITLATTALNALPTEINSTDSSYDEWGGGVVYDNGTVVSPVDGELIDEGSYILNTVLGLIIVLVASVMNALGLNLTKLDHVRQQSIPKRERKKEYMRMLWLAGIGIYIASQVFGSPIALRYLRPDWVAPLGSSSLIFNFLFARWLVGTPVTATDIRGTAVIVLGVILILVFSSINHGLSQSVTISELNGYWTRPSWLAYFVLLIIFTSSTYIVSNLLARLLASRASYSPLPSPNVELPTSRPRTPHPITAFFSRWVAGWKSLENKVLTQLENVFVRTHDARIVWLQGIGWAVAGGSLAGVCLVFTKAVVKIFWLPGHPLVHPSALLTLTFVFITAVLQIICLNKSLVCADTVVVVPLFYAGYTVFGFVNSLILFDQTGQYARWVLVAVFLSIGVLISGVVLLSLKSSASTDPDPYTVSTQPSESIRMRPQVRTKSLVNPDPTKGDADEERDVNGEGTGEPGKDVMWEVGSLSDDSEAEGQDGGKKERKGIGGSSSGRGERRGLLGVDEGEEGDGDQGRAPKGTDVDPFGGEGEEDGSGEYTGVKPDDDAEHAHR